MTILPMLALVVAQAQDTAAAEHQVVTRFEELMLIGLVFIIMFGLGAGLTPRDFVSALRKPWGLVIGWVTQFGIMPLLAFLLVIGLVMQLPLEVRCADRARCAAHGRRSRRHDVQHLHLLLQGESGAQRHDDHELHAVGPVDDAAGALRLRHAVHAGRLGAADPDRSTSSAALAVMLVPVAIAMAIRRYSANVGAVMELMGGDDRRLLHPVHDGHLGAAQLAPARGDSSGRSTSSRSASASSASPSRTCSPGRSRLHPMNARTVALETGIQNGPLAIAIVLLTFSRTTPTLRQDPPGAGAVLALHRHRRDLCDLLLPACQRGRGAEDPEPAVGRANVRARGPGPEPRPSRPSGEGAELTRPLDLASPIPLYRVLADTSRAG
jgi:hypothetical protein